MKFFIILIMVTLLSACAKTSQIIDARTSESFFESAALYKGKVTYLSDLEVSGERYRLFKQGSTGAVPLNAVKNNVLVEAKEYCRDKKIGNQRMLILSERQSVPPHALGNWPRFELVFTCIPQEEEPVVIQNEERTKGNDKYDKLLKLKSVYEAGAISEQEYQAEKKKLLNSE